ncbi:hypothetical protein HOI26_05680 [Candidatus Woesearchaeota archaeon]|jgi:hypothetical protein|nr:hypothetical protein [Candidatus Woesearchaeota archaeon]MBT5740557.1 hypothetical protein [Candidatus Woesearchaeota archaeon]
MRIVFALLLVVSVLLVGCTTVVQVEEQCNVDSDCIAATCCHASAAVNVDYAPDCENAICTAVCEPGTLDCGQGSIACVKNKCSVVLNE